MKTSFKLFLGAMLMAVVSLASCSKEEIAKVDDGQLHTCTMTFVGNRPSFDVTTKADAQNTTWADGSTIYLRMNSTTGMTTGTAVYSAAKGAWTLNYYGALYEGVSNLCTAIYVDNVASVEGQVINFSANSGIYTDVNGSYVYQNGDLVVKANLTPKTGRIRFQGTPNTEMRVYGISHYTIYENSTDRYTTTAEVISTTVGADGYTPYLYGYFSDSNEPTLGLWVDAKEAYTRYCSSAVLKVGESGKMTVPTQSSHNSWAEGLIFKYQDVYVKLIAVSGGTFVMGNPSSNDPYYYAHNVTLDGFCMQETEITMNLTNLNPSASVKLKPYTTSSYSGLSNLVSTISKAVGPSFELPTEAQWEFAARGGNASKGYKYSGSDVFDEVAAPSSLSYSGNYPDSFKEVKSKLPNELGFYDMSGNACEWCRDMYTQFTTAAQINPISTTGSYHVYKTGNPVYDRAYPYNSNYYLSSRLVLNW